MADMITVKVAQRSPSFQRHVAAIKKLGGRYDGVTQTWTLAAQYESTIVRPGISKVEVAAAPARCPHYTVQDGCPLHGETCRG